MAVPELPDFCGHSGWEIVHDLPHAVISELGSFLVAEYRKIRPGSTPAPQGPFARALRFLERAYVEGDLETTNAVVVSLLETLENRSDVFPEIIEALPAVLRKAHGDIPW